MNVFVYIAGLATIFSLLLQLSDLFPAYRDAKKAIFFVVLGTFIGTILGSLSSVTISVSTPESPLAIISLGIIVLFAVLLAFVSLVAIFTKDDKKRYELYKMTGAGIPIFIVIMLIAWGIYHAQTAPKPHFELTVGELMSISKFNLQNSNYDRAIVHLDRVKSKLSLSDPRHSAVEKKIEEIKETQAENNLK